MAPPNGTPARRRPTGQQPAASAPVRARRPTGAQRAIGGGAKLVCSAGPAQGQEFPLDGDEVVIGRAAENAVSIADTSVSRKHVLLRRTEAGWAASDMGSGNGTMVNGVTISEETPLSSGDVITLGDSELQLVEDAPARRPVPRRNSMGEVSMPRGRPLARSRTLSQGPELAQAKRKRFIRIAGLVGIVMAGGFTYKVIQNKKAAQVQQVEADKQRALAERQAIFQEGKNLARNGKWTEAKAKFEELEELEPGYAQGAVKRYLDVTIKEIPNQQLLDECAAALEANEVSKASKALSQVTKDTQQFERRDELRAKLEVKLKGNLDAARALLAATGDRAKMTELLNVANDVLGAIPDQRDALEFKKVAEAAINRIDHPVKVDNSGPAPTPWVEVQRRYATGDKTGALAMANECAAKSAQCKTLMRQIQEFDERSRKADSLSPNELLALLELDKKISGGELTPQSHNISVRVSGAYYKKAAAAKAAGDWATAAENARKVLAADPGNSGAQAIVAEARKTATELYQQGYSLKDQSPDEAAAVLQKVVQMTPAGDELHEKAARWLAKLGNR
ncbi:MAG: FHA domain-containing protein [Myxococcaceae bacterium]|nr:FHA domain-containing protein [Myxococcaceae bacterium]